MAMLVGCNQCGKQEHLSDGYHLVPDAWFTLKRGTAEAENFCGLTCLEIAVKKRIVVTFGTAVPPVSM